MSTLSSPAGLLVVATTSLATWAVWKLYKSLSKEASLPPGPPIHTTLSYLISILRPAPHIKLTEGARRYGGIYALKMFGHSGIVLSSVEAIQDVLEKNSALTGDRPAHYITEIIEGQDNNMLAARYGPRWRTLRRAAQKVMSPQACKAHIPIQEAESAQLLYDLITDPEDIKGQLRRTSTSVIMSVLYGIRVPSKTTPMFLDFWAMLNRHVSVTALGSLVVPELFPFLKYVPERLVKFKQDCKACRNEMRKVIGEMLQPVQKRLIDSKEEENGCAMEMMYKKAGEWEMDDDLLFYFGSIMMETGADTTSVFLMNFFLVLAAHPRVMLKLHQEMDRVVGRDRLPVWDDFESLEFLRATIHETHRFRPVTPWAAPHGAVDDVRYGDYIIPKGAVIVQNTWGVFHDEKVFKNHHEFYPERFIENPELAPYTDLSFGSGRRTCPGIHLAKSAMALNAMNIVWGFSITKAFAGDGTIIEPNITDYYDGLVNVPKEVKCSIKPRSAHHEQMMRQHFSNMHISFHPFEKDLKEAERLRAETMRQQA